MSDGPLLLALGGAGCMLFASLLARNGERVRTALRPHRRTSRKSS